LDSVTAVTNSLI